MIMKSEVHAAWFVHRDVVVELTLVDIRYGRMSVVTDSDLSPGTV